MSEALVRQQVEDWANALRAKDIDAVMSFYAHSIVSFDVGPPLRYGGTETNVEPGRQPWLPLVNPSLTRYAN